MRKQGVFSNLANGGTGQVNFTNDVQSTYQ